MSEDDEWLQQILDALQAGRDMEENFRLLVERYHRFLYGFFSRRSFSHADCLDLTQETFLGIYRGIGSFRRDARFETWLFKVATNAFRKHLRREAADKRAGEEVPLDTALEADGERFSLSRRNPCRTKRWSRPSAPGSCARPSTGCRIRCGSA
ncbi:MAG TPA: sigma-70 family RNA polymerase sigma factor [Thermoanaerobaculia bacterium]|nr:sigma-70 family RNA polymerase sigma factor [Thermoanaerobaculia bacterium]